jgi:hypothetical protein
MLKDLGTSAPLSNPIDELLALGAEIRGWQWAIREQLAKLSPGEIFGSSASTRNGALVSLYERSLDRTQRLLVEMAKLGIDVRLFRVRQSEAAIFVGLVEAVLTTSNLDLSTKQRSEIRRRFADHARVLVKECP